MVQGGHKILNESVELAARHPHPSVRFLHAAPRVLARSPGGFADLIYEHLPQPGQVCSGKLLIDPIILGNAIPEILDDRGNGIHPTEALERKSVVEGKSVDL